MSKGRPKKLLNASKKNYTKEEIAIKKAEEEKLYNYPRLDFSNYPVGLLKEAQKEWDRISRYIQDLPISELDQQTMIRYCNYSYLYDKASKELDEQGFLIDGRKNPLIDTVNSFSKELKTATNDLGLTINSRLKIVNPQELEKESDDPFAEMMNEVDSDD
ncbi:phage terminase small subunit P27 family [Enterococcus faecium]|uniref:phage terminase small subunit P27 family n=1 Tax=Enterococcus faecium TaxID=1352 RepID=UPI0035DC4A76